MEIQTKSEENPPTTVEFIIREVKEKKHKCSVCEKPFVRLTDLKTHMIVHKTVKDFPCSQCSKAFASSARLRMHQKLHEEREPVSCNFCGKTFKTPQYLKNHLRQHSERKYSCEECGDKFKFPSNLKQHIMRIHMKMKPSELTTKRYICGQCDKIFYTKFNFDMHQLAHSNIKTAECPVCFKMFRHKYNMKIHMAGHFRKKEKGKRKRNLKIFECAFCGEAYGNKTGIRKHIQTVHLRRLSKSSEPRKFEICKKEPRVKAERKFLDFKSDFPLENVKIKSEIDDSGCLEPNPMLQSFIECTETIKTEYEPSNFIKIEKE